MRSCGPPPPNSSDLSKAVATGTRCLPPFVVKQGYKAFKHINFSFMLVFDAIENKIILAMYYVSKVKHKEKHKA